MSNGDKSGRTLREMIRSESNELLAWWVLKNLDWSGGNSDENGQFLAAIIEEIQRQAVPNAAAPTEIPLGDGGLLVKSEQGPWKLKRKDSPFGGFQRCLDEYESEFVDAAIRATQSARSSIAARGETPRTDELDAALNGDDPACYSKMLALARELEDELGVSLRLGSAVMRVSKENFDALQAARSATLTTDEVAKMLVLGARQFVTGDMKLMCAPGESDRECLNRCKAEWLKKADDYLARSAKLDQMHPPEGYAAPQGSMQAAFPPADSRLTPAGAAPSASTDGRCHQCGAACDRAGCKKCDPTWP